MPPHSLGSGTISFGLVSIPVRLYTAASSAGVVVQPCCTAKCGSRIQQQIFCPVCNETVERNELVRGYEFSKDQYVQRQRRRAEGARGRGLQDHRHRASSSRWPTVDPIYFEKTYYLGPDKGGEKAYRLLSDAMAKAGQVALAKFVMRGKESLVLIRAGPGRPDAAHDVLRRRGPRLRRGRQGRVREDQGGRARAGPAAHRRPGQREFSPGQYTDEYRQRVLEMVNQKVEGKEITVAEPAAPRAQVIDLMEALKESLAKRGLPAEAADAQEAADQGRHHGRRRETQGRRSGRAARSARRADAEVTTTAPSRAISAAGPVPFTPFHMGPGLALRAVAGRHVSLMLLRFLPGRDRPRAGDPHSPW